MPLSIEIKKYILVCDDVPDNAEIIKILLEEEGYKIEVVHTGRAAIEQLRTQKYDLLILNMILPDMTGYDVVDSVQNDLKMKIPILFFTVVDDVISTNKNVLGIIIKPIDFEDFQQQVKAVLG
ncbi:MAG: response regulator transcription factor (plasmid) [Nodularia sp. CChRGM 3473]